MTIGSADVVWVWWGWVGWGGVGWDGVCVLELEIPGQDVFEAS